MNIELILLVLLFGLIVLGIAKIIKKGFSAGAVISLVITMSIFGLGLMLQLDTSEFMSNYEISEKTILLNDNGKITAGIIGVLDGKAAPRFFNEQEIKEHDILFQRNDLEKLKGNSYKVMIVSRNSFDKLEKIQFGGEDFSRDFILLLTSSENPIEIFTEEAVRKAIERDDLDAKYKEDAKKQRSEEIKKQIGESGQFKSAMFGILISEATDAGGPLFLLDEYNRGNVVIYDETFMFKVIKIVPNWLLRISSRIKIPGG